MPVFGQVLASETESHDKHTNKHNIGWHMIFLSLIQASSGALIQ